MTRMDLVISPESVRRCGCGYWAMNLVSACAVSTLLFACAPRSRPMAVVVETQSYAQAIEQICAVDGLVGIDEQTGELERAQKRYDYIAENTKNSDAIYFATVWRTKPPLEQADLLETEARGVHVRACALVNALRSQ